MTRHASCLAILACAWTFPLPAFADANLSRAFRDFANTVPIFDNSGIVFGNSPFASWQNRVGSEEKDAAFANLLKRSSRDQLKDLLDDPDPKVRTLALAGIYKLNDPHLLPLIAKMIDDGAQTFPAPPGMPQSSTPSEAGKYPPVPQTVGNVASGLLQTYIAPSFGMMFPNARIDHASFDAYWKTHGQRSYCAGWFAIRLLQATGGGLPPATERRLQFVRLRQDIDQIPGDDQVWTLLWLRGIYYSDSSGYPNMLVTDDGLCSLLRPLGFEKLRLALTGHPPTDDPDWSKNDAIQRVATEFMLRHVTQLFAPDKASMLVEMGKEGLRDPAHFAFADVAAWWRAAAAVKPADAPVILRQGYDDLVLARQSDSEEWSLLYALWHAAGKSNAPLIVDWFYHPYDSKDSFEYNNTRENAILRLERPGSPEDRQLLALFLADPRAAKLEPRLLADFATSINAWTKQPVLSREEVATLSGGRGKASYMKPPPQDVPGALERLQKSIPEWAP